MPAAPKVSVSVAGRLSPGLAVASTLLLASRRLARMSSIGPRGPGETLIVTAPAPATKLNTSTSLGRSITPPPETVVTPPAVDDDSGVAVVAVLP